MGLYLSKIFQSFVALVCQTDFALSSQNP